MREEENIEQEIWEDFKSLSEPSITDRFSYGSAAAHFGVSYEERTQLSQNGVDKQLMFDDDYRINEFLLNADPKNIDWGELKKLYPSNNKIEIKPSDNIFKDWWRDRKKLLLKIPNEESAKEYLIGIRWDGLPTCPRCEHTRVYILRTTRTFRCAKCAFKFSERVGTIFQNTKLELIKWYETIYLLTNIKTAKLSSIELSKAMRVTQKTAYWMARKIKTKIRDEDLAKIRIQLFKDISG